MTSPKPLEHSLREAVARNIDSWADFDHYMQHTFPSLRGVTREEVVDSFWQCRSSLAKADAILALPEALLAVSQSQPGCDAPDGAASAGAEPPVSAARDPDFHAKLTEERRTEISYYLNALGGYTRVFNAIADAVWAERNGLAVSPMRFAESMLGLATASPIGGSIQTLDDPKPLPDPSSQLLKYREALAPFAALGDFLAYLDEKVGHRIERGRPALQWTSAFGVQPPAISDDDFRRARSALTPSAGGVEP